MKILDWYNHQGHQYEFFKLGFDFFLTSSDLSEPVWNTDHRPLNKNVTLSDLERIIDVDFDVVMYRSGCDELLIKKIKRRGAKVIYVSQTVFEPELKIKPDAMVWNCKSVMMKFKKNFNCKHYAIVHGYDPEEFRPIDVEKNGRVLTLANAFMSRGSLLGYDIWKRAALTSGRCDVFGHGNEDIGVGRISSFADQIEIFSKYSAYFNPTLHSAMPRSRAEAMMCGMPLFTTKNYGIEEYIKDNECIYVDKNSNFEKIFSELSKSKYEYFSNKSREVALREFSLYRYLNNWSSVFSNL